MMKLGKGMTNLQIADLLRAVAAAYQLKDEDKNKFKIIAYQRAADAVEHASSELKDLWDDGKLDEVAGIGKSLASHLDELFRKGKSTHFELVMKGLSKPMFELMKIPGIGAKRAYKLAKELGIKSIDDLEKKAKQRKIEGLESFGKESQADILKAIKDHKGKVIRHLLPYAMGIANEIMAWMKKNKSVARIDTLGSLRRQASTVGDIDLAVASNKNKEVIDHFTNYPKKVRVLEKGDRTSSIILPGGVQVDLMVQPPQSYGSLLQHFTGSKHHNIALREYALKKGLSLSEYGIKSQNSKLKSQNYNSKLKIYEYSNEENFYNALSLAWIPPELREAMGEIEASRLSKLPKLIELTDIKADLQIHSSFDIETSHDLGESSMEAVIKQADELGHEYLAFTEHNPSKSRHSPQQIIDILKRKREKVDQLNYSIKKYTQMSKTPLRQGYEGLRKVFNSLEIDMLPQGGIPVPDKGLETLDFALISIHSSFDLPREEMTQRVINSFIHPKVKIFA
ncbi:MAG: helix-hairpin-helix domain-containing protein, partial [Patescibacteria group bacterium]